MLGFFHILIGNFFFTGIQIVLLVGISLSFLLRRLIFNLLIDHVNYLLFIYFLLFGFFGHSLRLDFFSLGVRFSS